MLGRLSVTVGGTEVPPPRSNVLQGLLGALLLAQGEPLRTERLTRLVWADRAETTSRESVHVGISRLRKWLRQLGGGPSIDYEDGYRLAVPGDDLDLHRFRARIERARAVEEPEPRTAVLVSALELRRGPVLTGMEYLDRTDVLLRSVEQHVREAVMDLADTARRVGGPERAIAAVRSLAGDLPFDEPLHAALIELLAAGGQPAEALNVYRRLSERLADELGVEPSGQVQDAYLRVLDRDRPFPAAAAPGADPRGAVAVPAQLPPGIPDFTGRSEEAALIAESLTGPPPAGRARAVAVTTIAGMGGIGKTALAVHVAHLLADAFPDGQLYANLTGDADARPEPAEVLDRFLRALGVSGSGVPPTPAERAALFRSRLAGRRVLVVLDGAVSEEQVRPLVPGSPGTAVLITSRNRLTGLEGATLLDLEVLSPPQAVDLLTRVIGPRRVAAEPEEAMEIAGLCGHIPLAVRIAAGRLVGRPNWSLAHLAEMLRDERGRLDELSVGDLAVRASFTTSYRPLPPATRRAFRVIGLLDVPDFTLWTVAALLGVPLNEARPHLERLIDAQLVNVVGTDATGGLRHRMHELIRLYARECAEAEDAPRQRTAALARALGAWLWLAENAADRIPGPAYASMHGTAPRWPLSPATAARLLADPLLWFSAELPALTAAARQACDLKLDELAWDLAACLEKFCDLRGAYDDWRHTHERALRLCRAARNKRGEAVLQRGLLEVVTWTSEGRNKPAMVVMRETAERLLRLFTELADERGMADALVQISWGLVAQGAKEEALATAERALRLAEPCGYLGGQARALQVQAVAHGEEDPHRALPCLERALEIAERLGNPRLKATVVQFLGVAHAFAGDLGTGQDMLNRSIMMAREMDDRYLETFSLVYLAKLFTAIGDLRARATADLALTYSRAGNFGHHRAEALAVLGELNLAAGDTSGAVACLEESVEVWRTRGWLPFLARTLRRLGDAYAAAGHHFAAEAARQEADGLAGRVPQ
ncbi:BTAD domain-containing putative transcriptional regulator [Actinomadura sp. WMMA1423]|uniref:AfsR/SARP family transcriptional regulator n=1 Tax=Actinomadura sp. WMMA1423 TaxID=2591108 RepID=UPI001146786F|nr:BTAD domain-containing putative transcriptional regulator [Actinomadura sp. WMMA1423]